MAVFHDNSARLVKDAADIIEVIGEHVPLQRAGIRYKGLCPFHSEKTPSFTVNQERQFYHCFGCNESGDVLSFMMKYHNMTFPDALAALARRYGVTLEESELSPDERRKKEERDLLHQVNGIAAEIFHRFLIENPGAAKARQYLDKRGIHQDIITRFQLGYAPERWDFLGQALVAHQVAEKDAVDAGLLVKKDDGGVYDRFRDRVVFPIFSVSGQVAGFGGRILGDGQPKYLNSPETAVFSKSNTLFGLYQTKAAIRQARRCLIVEGNFDLLSLVARGLEYVVAPLGTALTAQHVKILKRYTSEAIILFDGDQAGIKAAMRSVPLFLAEQLDAKVVVLPADQDPDSFVGKFGKEPLEQKIKQAKELPEFVFGRLVEEHGLSLAGKGKILRDLQPVIAAIGNSVQKKLFIAHFSDKLGLPPDAMLDRAGLFTPAVERSTPVPPANKPLKLSRNYQRVLEFLLADPDTLPSLLQAGLEEFAENENEAGKIIIEALKSLVLEHEEKAGAEELLENLPQRERSFVAQVLIDAPSFAGEIKEAMLEEMAAWLRRQVWQLRKATLVKSIHEAQLHGNDDLLMELLEKKKEMDEASYP
ncbi:MAG: DNA primase [Pseudomonadota bacterium]